jgi:hypothetical protein
MSKITKYFFPRSKSVASEFTVGMLSSSPSQTRPLRNKEMEITDFTSTETVNETRTSASSIHLDART